MGCRVKRQGGVRLIPAFLRRRHDLGGPFCCEFPSATRGAHFSAVIVGSWRQGSAFHGDRLALVRADIVRVSREIAETWHADEKEQCENAINARLGAPQRCPSSFYLDRWARVVLEVDDESIGVAKKRKEDCARIERLKRMAELLYGDPKLLMVEYFERYPNRDFGDEEIKKIRRFAAQVRGFDDWWSPIMQAWVEISASTKSAVTPNLSLDLLREVILTLDSRLSKEEIGSSNLAHYIRSSAP